MGKIETAIESVFKAREAARQLVIAKEQAWEEKRRSEELEKERAEDARFLECKRVIEESSCQELFEEVNNTYLDGKGSISLERTEEEQDRFYPPHIYDGKFRDLISYGPGAKLVLIGERQGKQFQLQAFASRGEIDKMWGSEFLGLQIKCYSREKRLLDRLPIGEQKWNSSYSDLIREENDWKNPDEVANAIATVLVEQGITS